MNHNRWKQLCFRPWETRDTPTRRNIDHRTRKPVDLWWREGLLTVVWPDGMFAFIDYMTTVSGWLGSLHSEKNVKIILDSRTSTKSQKRKTSFLSSWAYPECPHLRLFWFKSPLWCLVWTRPRVLVWILGERCWLAGWPSEPRPPVALQTSHSAGAGSSWQGARCLFWAPESMSLVCVNCS